MARRRSYTDENEPSLSSLIRMYDRGDLLTNWQRARVHGHQRAKGEQERLERGWTPDKKPLVAKIYKKVEQDEKEF